MADAEPPADVPVAAAAAAIVNPFLDPPVAAAPAGVAPPAPVEPEDVLAAFMT